MADEIEFLAGRRVSIVRQIKELEGMKAKESAAIQGKLKEAGLAKLETATYVTQIISPDERATLDLDMLKAILLKLLKDAKQVADIIEEATDYTPVTPYVRVNPRPGVAA